MNEVIRRLSIKCKDLAKHNITFITFYNETIDLVLKGEYEDENKKKLLVELYRYAYYSGVKTAIDPRFDKDFKLSALNEVNESLKKGELTDEVINNLQKFNDFIRNFVDYPIEFIKKEIKFYLEHPTAKF